MGGAPGMEPVGAARGAVSVMGSFIMAMNSSWCCMITWNSSGLCWPVDHHQQRSAPDTCSDATPSYKTCVAQRASGTYR